MISKYHRRRRRQVSFAAEAELDSAQATLGWNRARLISDEAEVLRDKSLWVIQNDGV